MNTKTLSTLSAWLVSLIAFLAFTLSFEAIRQLAIETGTPELFSWLIPLIVDGAMIVFSTHVLRATLLGERTWWGWALIFTFTAVSVTFNIAHAQTSWLAWMIAALAFEEKLHAKKSIIVGTFAGVCLIAETILARVLDKRLVPFGEVRLPNGHMIELPVYIPAIDWGVITIILGASLFVEVTSRSGIFTWMAIKLTKKSGGDPWRLLLAYGGLGKVQMTPCGSHATCRGHRNKSTQ